MTRPLIVFAHGAGVGSSSEWMQSWRRRLETLGDVVTFDYPYMQAGKKRPDPQHKLIEAHRAALRQARGNRDVPVVLAGKSMGSRIGCHVALEEPVDALVCFGYPLVSPGKSQAVRDEVLRRLETPILFVQGRKDRLCPLERLEEVRGAMRAPNELYVVEGGDHSLAIGKRFAREQGTDQAEVDEGVQQAIERFVREHVGE